MATTRSSLSSWAKFRGTCWQLAEPWLVGTRRKKVLERSEAPFGSARSLAPLLRALAFVRTLPAATADAAARPADHRCHALCSCPLRVDSGRLKVRRNSKAAP